ncbi:hypothetical protein ACLOJK_013475 [Asimina triloba]
MPMNGRDCTELMVPAGIAARSRRDPAIVSISLHEKFMGRCGAVSAISFLVRRVFCVKQIGKVRKPNENGCLDYQLTCPAAYYVDVIRCVERAAGMAN